MTDFIITKIIRFVGNKLDGYKTIIGGLGLILTGVLGFIRLMFPDLTQFPSMTIGEILVSISAGMTAIGLGGKAEKLKEEVHKGNIIVDDKEEKIDG